MEYDRNMLLFETIVVILGLFPYQNGIMPIQKLSTWKPDGHGTGIAWLPDIYMFFPCITSISCALFVKKKKLDNLMCLLEFECTKRPHCMHPLLEWIMFINAICKTKNLVQISYDSHILL